MKKQLGLKLRDTEVIIECEGVTSWINKKARECQLAIVGSKYQNFELAIFLFRPSRMYMINNKIELVTVFPITKELSINTRTSGFALRWLHFTETQIEVQTKSDKLYTYILNHLREASTYQREAFKTGSPTHQWVWYYQNSIHPRLKDSSPRGSDMFSARETVEFRPEHFGQDIMCSYIKEQMKKRENDYSSNEEIKVFVGTWNTAGTAPIKTVSLSGWLRSGSLKQDENYQIIVICLQEMCSLTAKNIMGDEIREAEWEDYLNQQVFDAFPGKIYAKVRTMQLGKQSLWGLLTLVYIDQEVIQNISFLAECSVKLGLKGYMGNKGAVSLRFEYLNTSFCIINCHLAAHKKNVKSRNENVGCVLKQTVFNLRKREIGVYEHDYVIWAGDFNYRLEGLSHENIKSFIQRKDFRRLLVYDQLIKLRNSEKLLHDFVEELIVFRPTYKYVKGSNEYTDNREPSWCDRILVRGEVRILNYMAYEELYQSDHKPVYSEMIFVVNRINPEMRSCVQMEIIEYAKRVYTSPNEV